MAKRDARAALIVGKQGGGKSFQTDKEIELYRKKFRRPVLIVDVKGEYTKYKAVYYDPLEENMDIRASGRRNSNGLGIAGIKLPHIYRIICKRPQDGIAMDTDQNVELMLTISKYFKNGMLIIEEMNSIIRRTVPARFYSFLTTLRHNGVDVIFHFQSFGDAHPDIISQCTMFRIHKTNDSLESIKGKRGITPERYDIARIAEMAINENYMKGILMENEAKQKYGSPDNFPKDVKDEINKYKYYFLYVDFDFSQIRGIHPDEFKKQCTAFLWAEKPKQIRSQLKVRDGAGKRLYKHETEVVEKMVNDMMMVYVR